MSIVAYTGLPGSGKSYGVVENVLLPALQTNRVIYTNIPLKLGTIADEYPKSEIIYFDSKEVDNEYFNLDDRGAGAIWLIDEVQHFWPTGLKQNNIPKNIISFFTEHRHFVGSDGMTTEIVLVTQDLSQVCAFVRGLVEETYRAQKLTAVGSKNKYRVDVFMGAAVGQKPPRDKMIRQLYGTYKSEIYRFYKSHTKNKTDFAAGMEEKADDRANVLKHPLVKYGIPLSILLMIFSIYKVLSYFNRDSEKIESDEIKPVSQNVIKNSVSTEKKTYLTELAIYQKSLELDQLALPISDTHRITGRINHAFLIASESGDRWVPRSKCSQFTNTFEDYCVISGKIVTWFSWKRPVNEDDSREYFSSVKDEFN